MPNIKSEPKTEKFILKPGNKHHGLKDGERHWFNGDEPGNNVVELNAEQAKAFADKFVSKREYETRLRVAKELAEEPVQDTSELDELKKKFEEAEAAKAKAEKEAEEAKAKAEAAEKGKAEAEAELAKAKTEKPASESSSGGSATNKVVPPSTK